MSLLWWGLKKRENGDVYDSYGTYGERFIDNDRVVDGVVVPV